jgi:hypothetical protein
MREPFSSGLPIPYRENFSAAEFAKLKDGLIPRVMEDKWFIYFDEPYLFLHRSWTGKPVYRVRLSTECDAATVTEALCVPEGLESYEPDYQANLLDF